MKRTGLALSFLALTVSACANVEHRPKIISSKGVDSEIIADANAFAESPVLQFYKTARAAYPNSIPEKPDPDIQWQFLDTGFRLIKSRCGDYIGGKADRQRTLNVWRDTFAPITALVTGAVALSSDGDSVNNDYLTAISLATTAGAAGFEIYEERFLFGARNMGSVETLIKNALDVDSSAKLSLNRNTFTYAKSVDWLEENQKICHPQHILVLVEDAIANGKVVPVAKGGGPARTEGNGGNTTPEGSDVADSTTNDGGTNANTEPGETTGVMIDPLGS